MLRDEFLRSIPKVELHCHIEGSVRAATFADQAKKHGIAIVGSIVVSTFPDSRPAPPSSSPFEHIAIDGAAPRGAPGARKISAAQLEWAKYLEAYPETAEEKGEPVLHNTAFFIDEHGEVVGRYIKRNLWHSERCVTVRAR